MEPEGSVFVSVIIPTYNREDYVERALRSVHAQSYSDYEVIIVDDGSTDNSVRLISALESQLRPTRKWSVLRQKNLGVSAARNLGAREASGKWLAFLDSDDEWAPTKLTEQNLFVEQNPDYKIVYTNELWKKNGVDFSAKKKHQKMAGWIFADCLKECFIGCSTVMILRSFFESSGGFRENFLACEDYDLWLKITAQEPVGYIEKKLTIKHGGRPDQLSTSIKCLDYFRVKAIDSILQTPGLSESHGEKALAVLSAKCAILLKGYLKHSNMENYEEVVAIQRRWKKEIIL